MLIAFYGCDKDNKCLKSNGNVVSEMRVVTNQITNIDLDHNIHLIITQDSTPSLRLEGGANLLSKIRTDIESNTLKLYSENKCSYLRSYDNGIKAYLSLPNITHIEYRGFGDITCTNTLNFPSFIIDSRQGTGNINLDINSDEIFIRQHNGPADFSFSGTCKKTYIYTLGNGWFYFQNLESEQVHVNHEGTGDVSVKANNSLLVELYYIGNLYYYGNPTVTVSQHSGSGKIEKK